jgi:3-hydroxyisobutyrate dehydrogenase-like beta-hydroxyacid dehydrogenase
MKKIAVLGLGIIGQAWAKNLHEDGLDVRAWNRTPKALPYFQKDLVAAIDGAEMIIIVVSDPPAVSEILDRIVPQLKPGQLIVQSSTISAAWTHTFCDRVEKQGATFLEAPFTGSKPAAEKRETVFFLGGPEDVVEKARPVLNRLGSRILHIGATGSASSLKLALNLNLAIMAESLSEALLLTRAEKIPDEKFFEALHCNAGRSPMAEMKEPKLMKQDFAPQFSLKHMGKDLRLALETAGDQQLPLASNLKSLYDSAMKKGWGDDDFVGLIRLVAGSK